MASLYKQVKRDDGTTAVVDELSGATIGAWCRARAEMEPDFQVTRSLRGLTPAMRAMGTVFLPTTAREKDEWAEYRCRLNRTFLHPGYAQGVDDIAAKPFQRPVQLTKNETLPEELQRIELDADRNGNSLTQVASQEFDGALDRGLAGILVDHPPAGGADETGKDDIEKDRRPFFRVIHADNLLDWGWERNDAYKEVLSFVAIYSEKEHTKQTDAGGKKVKVQCIQYWTATEWQKWEREAPDTAALNLTSGGSLTLESVAQHNAAQMQGSTQASYAKVGEGKHECGCVPFVPCVIGAKRTQRGDPWNVQPTLMALAWKNLDHWQVGSGRNNLLHFAGNPILRGKGFTKEEAEKPVILGAGAQKISSNDSMDLAYVEPSGTSAGTMKERDLELVDQMTALAMAPLMRVSNKTATGVEADDKTAQCKAQAWVERLEWCVYRAYEIAMKWVSGPSAELPEDFDVAIFRDFSLRARAADDLRVLGEARGRKDISRETWIQEAIERGLLVTVDDAEEEMERIDEEGEAAVESMMANMPPAPDDEEQPQDGQPPQPGQPPQKNMPPQLGKGPVPRQAVGA